MEHPGVHVAIRTSRRARPWYGAKPPCIARYDVLTRMRPSLRLLRDGDLAEHGKLRSSKHRKLLQVTSKRVANAKSDKYHGNILKRGKVELQKVRAMHWDTLQ